MSGFVPLISNNNNKSLDMVYQAVQSGNLKYVKKFVNRGNVNLRDEEGNTFLHRAAELGNQSMMRLLIELGAHTNIKNSKDLKAYQLLPAGRPELRIVFFS